MGYNLSILYIYIYIYIYLGISDVLRCPVTPNFVFRVLVCFSMSIYFKISCCNHHPPGKSAGDLFGMVKTFQRLSDLQLGDKKVTLNHLARTFFLEGNLTSTQFGRMKVPISEVLLQEGRSKSTPLKINMFPRKIAF